MKGLPRSGGCAQQGPKQGGWNGWHRYQLGGGYTSCMGVGWSRASGGLDASGGPRRGRSRCPSPPESETPL